MTPEVFLYASSIFFICMAVHVIVWRTRVPAHDALSLFFIFIIFPVLIAGILFNLGIDSLPGSLPQSGWFCIAILHLSYSLVYIASYPAVQAISPSLDILLVIAATKTKRSTETEIIHNYNDAELVDARIQDLEKSILVVQEKNKFKLTAFGKIVIICFITYRRMLGLPAGKG